MMILYSSFLVLWNLPNKNRALFDIIPNFRFVIQNEIRTISGEVVFSTNLNLILRRNQFITGEGGDPVNCVFVAAKSATHHLVETTQNPLVIPWYPWDLYIPLQSLSSLGGPASCSSWRAMEGEQKLSLRYFELYWLFNLYEECFKMENAQSQLCCWQIIGFDPLTVILYVK